MREIYIVVNPKGATGKTHIAHEILMPHLSTAGDCVKYFKINCIESRNARAVAYDYPVGSPNFPIVFFKLLDSVLSVDAAVIEIGSGSTFQNFLSHAYLAELQEIDLRPVIIIPSSDVDPKAIGVSKVLNILRENDRTFHRLDIRVVFTPTREERFYYEGIIAATREAANQGGARFIGSIPFFPWFDRQYGLDLSWKEILENPKYFIAKSYLGGIQPLNKDIMGKEKNWDYNKALQLFTDIPEQLRLLRETFDKVGQRNSIFEPPRL